MNNDYASHMMILAALGRAIGHDVFNVVEMGCGFFSTPLWLNKDIWTSVRALFVFEHNAAWRSRIDCITFDSRLSFWSAERPCAILNADIIFIDNGDTKKQRLEAIALVVERNPTGLVILHDADEQQYLDAILPHFEHKLICTNEYPYTGLFWNGDRWSEEQIMKIINGIEAYKCLQLT